MDQNLKQCSDIAVYFYQIRWFDITGFAFKAPKVLEVVEITASYSSPFVCKYCKLYIQQIWERSHPYHGDDGPESEARCRFRNVFLLNTVVWHYRFCFQCSETAKSSQNIGHSPPPPPPPPPPLFCKYYYLYIQYISKRSRLYSSASRMCNKVSISLCISIKCDGLTLSRLSARLQKCMKYSS